MHTSQMEVCRRRQKSSERVRSGKLDLRIGGPRLDDNGLLIVGVFGDRLCCLQTLGMR